MRCRPRASLEIDKRPTAPAYGGANSIRVALEDQDVILELLKADGTAGRVTDGTVAIVHE
jgi:hypothetical protein